MFTFLSSDEYSENKIYKKRPLNEMEILSIINKRKDLFFNILPDLPYSTNSILFDPASYGQYLLKVISE